jgi:hypothetical protein
MKKEALELVRSVFHSLKWDIPHPDLETILIGSKSACRIFCGRLIEAAPEQKEKYELMAREIDNVTLKQVY